MSKAKKWIEKVKESKRLGEQNYYNRPDVKSDDLKKNIKNFPLFGWILIAFTFFCLLFMCIFFITFSGRILF